MGGHERFSSGGNLGLMRMGVRLYDSALGRFLQVDPVEGGSDNDYEYVGGDPVNALDLDGMAKKCKTWDVGCKAKKLAKGALNNRYVRGAVTIAIVGAVCSNPVSCVAGGMAVGAALRGANYAANSRERSARGFARAGLLGSEEGGLALTGGLVRGALLKAAGAYGGQKLAHGSLSFAARLVRNKYFPRLYP